MKKTIKSITLICLISLPILSTLLFAGEGCSDPSTGACVEVGITGDKIDICFFGCFIGTR